jgi:hypothetical protein
MPGQFLSHVANCVHPMVSECPDCTAFAKAADTVGKSWTLA